MKNLITEHKILAIIILVLFIFSLLCQIIIGFLYQNMIKETYNMSSTENKLLKTCKLKFANRYELHAGMSNITVFVDKFLHSIRFGPISVKGLYHFSGQLLLLAIFVSGAGACRAIAAEETLGEILSYYLIVFFMLYAYFSVATLVDVKGKRAILKTNLIDYLENNMSARIPQSKKEQERLDELEAEGMKKEKAGIFSGSKQNPDKKPDTEQEKQTGSITEFASHKKRNNTDKKLAPEEVKELEGLLREFVSNT